MLRFDLAAMSLTVEHRSGAATAGPSLRIHGPAPERRELIRFDCFDDAPHWHLDPSGGDERSPIADDVDPVGWTIHSLRDDLDSWLARAHASALERPERTELEAILARAEAALRNPPARLQELDIARLRRRRGEKWSTYPPEILPAWVAEMDFPLAEPVRRVIARAASNGDLGYPLAARDTGLPEVFCERMAKHFDWSVAPQQVEVLSDVVQGMVWALHALRRDRPGVVVQTPIYPPFLRSVRDTGRRLVENRLVPGPVRDEIDFDALERDADSRTGMLLFCNPHNPSGRAFDRAELERLAAIAVERDWIVVSDEIHADLLYDGRRHVPLASLGPEIAERTITLTSATKAFNIPGLRCAIAHFGSTSLRRETFAAAPRKLAGGLGLPGLYATMAAWQHADPWLDEVRAQLQANRDFLVREIPKRFPGIGFRAPEATYLAWLDCAALPIEGAPAAHLFARGKVALSAGGLFGEGFERYVRLNFGTSPALLGEALDRMESALIG